MQTTTMSRRSFVASAACTAAATGVAALANAAAAGAAEASDAPTFADTVAWDGRYDVVICGFGGAGAVAAKAAADAGATVLIVDKAPFGGEGGNSRYCAQDFFTCDDYELGLEYYRTLAQDYEYDEEVLEVYIQGLVDMLPWLKESYGVEATKFDGEIIEFPTVEHNALYECTVSGKHSDAQLWKTVRRPVVDGSYAGQIDFWYASPAKRLIQDPATKTIVGVVIDKDGEGEVAIRADRGVVMTIGGFENNRAMHESYFGLTNLHPVGSLYNTGDGFAMVQEVGAKMRDMNNWCGYGNCGGFVIPVAQDRHAHEWLDTAFCEGSMLVAGGDGRRYVNENIAEFGHPTRENKHGRIDICGEWLHANFPTRNHYIFDQAQYDDLEAAGSLADYMLDVMVSADSVEKLAEQLEGVDAAKLAETIERYNTCVELGDDLMCDRPAASMRAIDTTTTLYAMPLEVNMMFTFGGPTRNARCEVVGNDGQVIPNLYAAGEFGALISKYYAGDGNVSDYLVMGRIAGENAAAVKPALPTLTDGRAAVESTYTYTVDADYPRFELAEYAPENDNEYIGESTNGIGDRTVVKVTMDGDTIADVAILEIHDTIGICDPAIVSVPAAIVEANSTEVDTAAGATITSLSLIEAVEDALAQVK